MIRRASGRTPKLAHFAPIDFGDSIVSRVENAVRARQMSVRRMPSGASHDVQMFAPNCPSALAYGPSADGLSDNINEHTEDADFAAGA